MRAICCVAVIGCLVVSCKDKKEVAAASASAASPPAPGTAGAARPPFAAIAVVDRHGLALPLSCFTAATSEAQNGAACVQSMRGQKARVGAQIVTLSKRAGAWCPGDVTREAFDVGAPEGTLVVVPPDFPVTAPATGDAAVPDEVAAAVSLPAPARRTQSLVGRFGTLLGTPTVVDSDDTLLRVEAEGKQALAMLRGGKQAVVVASAVGADGVALLGALDLDGDGAAAPVIQRRVGTGAAATVSYDTVSCELSKDEYLCGAGDTVDDCAGGRVQRAEPPELLDWIAVLYPGATIKDDVLGPISRDGLRGAVQRAGARSVPVEGGRLVAFIIDFPAGLKSRRLMQVLLVDEKGVFLAKPDGFPIGGDSGEAPSGTESPWDKLRVESFEPIQGSPRAAVLSYVRDSETLLSRAFAVDAKAKKIVVSEDFDGAKVTKLAVEGKVLGGSTAEGPRELLRVP